mmetsp:Transcript_54411/g.158064  ORF Transcript_54411/g.158064 Transcript_54411/m.158064 type:complete len:235 (-) Transcript_54411:120-824(-)
MCPQAKPCAKVPSMLVKRPLAPVHGHETLELGRHACLLRFSVLYPIASRISDRLWSPRHGRSRKHLPQPPSGHRSDVPQALSLAPHGTHSAANAVANLGNPACAGKYAEQDREPLGFRAEDRCEQSHHLAQGDGRRGATAYDGRFAVAAADLPRLLTVPTPMTALLTRLSTKMHPLSARWPVSSTTECRRHADRRTVGGRSAAPLRRRRCSPYGRGVVGRRRSRGGTAPGNAAE